MLNPGFVTRKALAQWQDVPTFLPQFQFHEKHRTVIHTAHPIHILPLIANFDVRQDAVIRRLMALRQLPQKLLRDQQADSISNFGLHSFTLLKNSASELCYGLRGQFWRADFGLKRAGCQRVSDACRAGQRDTVAALPGKGTGTRPAWTQYGNVRLLPGQKHPAQDGSLLAGNTGGQRLDPQENAESG